MGSSPDIFEIVFGFVEQVQYAWYTGRSFVHIFCNSEFYGTVSYFISIRLPGKLLKNAIGRYMSFR